MNATADYTITLTDGTIATPTHASCDWLQELSGTCLPLCWYDEYTTSDGIKFEGLYQRTMVGTYDVNDFNSPIHYDHLDMQYPWTMFAIGGSNAHSPNVGNHPDCMEGHPVCVPMSSVNQSGSVVVPFNDSLTVLCGGAGAMQSFGVKC